jgi:FtsP/CotA-like multicopper oxidase with cupredoxin domain
MKAGAKYLLFLSNTGGQITNIHTHGLHISGDGNADNVMRELPASGQCLGYNWTIPDDHHAGTFWYHSHIHGDVSIGELRGHTREQVGGGAYGFLFIEEKKKRWKLCLGFPCNCYQQYKLPKVLG